MVPFVLLVLEINVLLGEKLLLSISGDYESNSVLMPGDISSYYYD